MMRYMAIQAIKQDPAWMDGEYKTEPKQGSNNANEMIFRHAAQAYAAVAGGRPRQRASRPSNLSTVI